VQDRERVALNCLEAPLDVPHVMVLNAANLQP
jgi:hypothetical protein